MKNRDFTKSLDKLVSIVLIDPEMPEILLNPKRRGAILDNPNIEIDFSEEERELLRGIEAKDTEEFFKQAYEGYIKIHHLGPESRPPWVNHIRETVSRLHILNHPGKERC